MNGDFFLSYRLYERGHIGKVEKLRCILHYFQRITEKSEVSLLIDFLGEFHVDLVPNGAITIRRRLLPKSAWPNWSKSTQGLVPMHLTTSEKIEDIDNALQVDFANKYIVSDRMTVIVHG